MRNAPLKLEAGARARACNRSRPKRNRVRKHRQKAGKKCFFFLFVGWSRLILNMVPVPFHVISHTYTLPHGSRGRGCSPRRLPTTEKNHKHFIIYLHTTKIILSELK